MERHPSISIHRIAVGDGIMGAVFGVGVCVIFLVGVVEVRWFLLIRCAANLVLQGGVKSANGEAVLL